MGFGARTRSLFLTLCEFQKKMNDFVLKFNTYPLGQKILVLVVVLILILIGFYFLHYQEYEGQVARRQAELQALVQRRDKVAALERSREQVLRQLETLRLQIRAAKTKLPDSDDVPELLQSIYSQAKTAGLDIRVFQRESDVDTEFYTEIPVTMELEGSYDELANFVFYVQENISRIVNIKNIEVEQAKASAGPDASGDLKIKTSATTYMYKPIAPPTAPPGTPPAPGAKP